MNRIVMLQAKIGVPQQDERSGVEPTGLTDFFKAMAGIRDGYNVIRRLSACPCLP